MNTDRFGPNFSFSGLRFQISDSVAWRAGRLGGFKPKRKRFEPRRNQANKVRGRTTIAKKTKVEKLSGRLRARHAARFRIVWQPRLAGTLSPPALPSQLGGLGGSAKTLFQSELTFAATGLLIGRGEEGVEAVGELRGFQPVGEQVQFQSGKTECGSAGEIKPRRAVLGHRGAAVA